LQLSNEFPKLATLVPIHSHSESIMTCS